MSLLHRLACSSVVVIAVLAAGQMLLVGSALGGDHSDETLPVLDKKIAAHPGDAALYLERGRIYEGDQANLAKALADFERAVELNPRFFAAQLARGAVLYRLGDNPRALAALDAAITLRSDDRHAFVIRGMVRSALGRPLDAAADYRRAVALAERAGHPIASDYLALADALAMAGPRHFAEAVRVIDQGLGHFSVAPGLELRAIELDSERGAHDRALQRLDRAAARDRRKEWWFERRGDVLARAGRSEEARRAYARGLEVIAALPEHRRQTIAVAKLHARLEQKRDALR